MLSFPLIRITDRPLPKSSTIHSKAAASLLACVFSVVAACKSSEAGLADEPLGGHSDKLKSGRVPVDLYVMSQCPYGVQAESRMIEVAQKLGASLDLHIDYIGERSATGELSSMHGPKEVIGDTVQLCSMKHAPDKYLNMIACQNRSVREIDANWEQCATGLGMPVEKIRSCTTGEEGRKLLGDSFNRSKQRGAKSSPSIYVAGKSYQGGRRGNDLLRAICAEFKGTLPNACVSIPEDPKVNATILSDRRCTECQSTHYEGMLKNRVANPIVKMLDYSEREGRRLYDELKPGNLPVIVFDSTLDADKEASEQLGRQLRPAGIYRVMALGVEWNPVCAGEGGCNLDECRNNLSCRKEAPNKLDVFVMSQCPFGVKALNAMEEVLTNFRNKLDFSIHFIGEGDAKSGLKSMHGSGEVDEDIREVCAIKHFSRDHKFMNYILCRNRDVRGTDWESCTGDKTGIDKAVMKKCIDGEEGKQLLEAEFKAAQAMGVRSSPTWLANNRFKFSAVDAESIRKNLCDHNKDLKGCENKLSGSNGPPVQGGCGH